VAAVPADQSQGWAFLSSGTWSLLGVELDQPLMTDAARELNFTNEAGYGGTTRFLKNIIGLWILQECRRQWSEAGQHLEYDEISQLAEQAEPLRSLINPNDSRFLKPDGMPEKIAQFCRESSQPVPATPGQFARCILESLALLYHKNLDALEELTGQKIETLHIVGGGSNSLLLNQFAANATGRTVIAGPVEATAIGNLLIQAISLGDLKSLAELREVVRNSFEIKTYQPKQTIDWLAASVRFSKLEILK
jgi:rhamnulokinase